MHLINIISPTAAIVKIFHVMDQRPPTKLALCAPSPVTGDKIILPGSRTKNGREHIVPIPPLCGLCLDEHSGALAKLFLGGAKDSVVGPHARPRLIDVSARAGQS